MCYSIGGRESTDKQPRVSGSIWKLFDPLGDHNGSDLQSGRQNNCPNPVEAAYYLS